MIQPVVLLGDPAPGTGGGTFSGNLVISRESLTEKELVFNAAFVSGGSFGSGVFVSSLP